MQSVETPSELSGSATGTNSPRFSAPASAALSIEKWYPLVGGLVVGAASFVVVMSDAVDVQKTFAGVLSAMVSVGGILAGFLATARSVLLTVQGTRLIGDLRKTGYYAIVLRHLKAATLWSCAMSAYSCVLLFVDWSAPWSWRGSLAFGAWAGICTAALLAFYRMTKIYNAILKVSRI